MRRPIHRPRFPWETILAAALLLAVPPPARSAPGASAPAAPVSTEAAQAVFLGHFIGFTDWPPGVPPRDAPYVLGISGNRALEDELIRLADRQLIRGHRIRVVRLRNARDLEGVHLAYFDAASEALPEVLPAREALPLLRGRPVLTVSDADGFLELGGMIGLYREQSALRFEIDAEHAREAGLAFRSHLLALARNRQRAPAPPAPPAAPPSPPPDAPAPAP